MLICIFTGSKNIFNVQSKTFTYLALGDSYTIGESVPDKENFPNQTVQLLRKAGFDLAAPEIIAKTGWTTDELQDAINKHSFHIPYDLVTLLIGVNDQYRGGSVENYRSEFESLLKQAIQFAGNKKDHVIVLSIPDWSVTPFAKDRNKNKIEKEINEYNAANKILSEKYKVHYIDITAGTREAANDPALVSGDGLHPSAKEYAKWAERITNIMKGYL